MRTRRLPLQLDCRRRVEAADAPQVKDGRHYVETLDDVVHHAHAPARYGNEKRHTRGILVQVVL